MSQIITELLGIQYPIIQAPMAGVSTPLLAAEVTHAGALGSIGIGACSVAETERMLDVLAAQTTGPVNVNVFCHKGAQQQRQKEQAWLDYLAPYFAEFNAPIPEQLHEIYKSFVDHHEMLQLLLCKRPAVVSFHFGLPSTDYIQALKQVGIVLMATATSLKEAYLIQEAGIDIVVAQGQEAGGHQGIFEPDNITQIMPTLVLTRLISENLSIPVVSAGGIMNGQDIKQAFKQGASAVQMGTAFLLCSESATSEDHRMAIKKATTGATQMTSVISGRPARGLINRFMTQIDQIGRPDIPDYPIAYDAAKALYKAASAEQKHGFAAHWAGSKVEQTRQMSAKQLIECLVQEFTQAG
ncbi:NAD(P)H-dependent flavin oxidoreductase [Neisseria sp. Ec49-e6-T10]|uniref:NAD(P)H-dependent flavin oxidoreductase n=1 Tax=Neisseria sp. Ec49-e6-T10 TaxID=3140744 RepID=UPI003EB781DF